MHGRGKLRIKFLYYSASKEYLAQPDIVEYDEATMSQPGFDLILGTNTLKKLGIVVNFQTKEVDIDEIILPMTESPNFHIEPRLKGHGWQTIFS